jgi:hypothetical protein
MVEGRGKFFKTDKGYFILLDKSLHSSDFPFSLEPETAMDVRLHLDDKRNELYVERYKKNYVDIIRTIEESLIKEVSLSSKLRPFDEISQSIVSCLTKYLPSLRLPSLTYNENKEVIEKIQRNVGRFSNEIMEEFERNGNIREFRGIKPKKKNLSYLYSFSGKELSSPSKSFLDYVKSLFHEEKYKVEKIPVLEAEMINAIKKRTVIRKFPTYKIEEGRRAIIDWIKNAMKEGEVPLRREMRKALHTHVGTYGFDTYREAKKTALEELAVEQLLEHNGRLSELQFVKKFRLTPHLYGLKWAYLTKKAGFYHSFNRSVFKTEEEFLMALDDLMQIYDDSEEHISITKKVSEILGVMPDRFGLTHRTAVEKILGGKIRLTNWMDRGKFVKKIREILKQGPLESDEIFAMMKGLKEIEKYCINSPTESRKLYGVVSGTLQRLNNEGEIYEIRVVTSAGRRGKIYCYENFLKDAIRLASERSSYYFSERGVEAIKKGGIIERTLEIMFYLDKEGKSITHSNVFKEYKKQYPDYSIPNLSGPFSDLKNKGFIAVIRKGKTKHKAPAFEYSLLLKESDLETVLPEVIAPALSYNMGRHQSYK